MPLPCIPSTSVAGLEDDRLLESVFVNDIGGQFLIRKGASDSCECVPATEIWGPADKITWPVLTKKGAT